MLALRGLAFDRSTPRGRMMATIIAGLATFERELIQERVRSGIAAARLGANVLAGNPDSGRNPTAPRRRPSPWSPTGAATA